MEASIEEIKSRYSRYRDPRFTDPEMAALLLRPVVVYLLSVSY